ncbi:BREX-1 system adenine-specific DNA-methyltransferase PglX [Myroides odoratimimus]|uniref:BREX-1 system adenine-specific DNA-methyltransferase PglX n=1 Tax=Myroides odoratimimus TaxID=76832 RepID=UPI0025774BB0|nr:BREX-1 system adenine-specific DNA-methyltransferase PglX [Myroides odoratimimus]MDM1526682.1 BREX-1 system adenine-specific DNA-methyltransferase PglX [Myroides odoratimimus]
MKLSEHTNHIRQKVKSAVSNRLDRLGITLEATEISLSAEQQKEKERLLEVFQSLKEETGTKEKAYEKLVDELTFTLFNRIAALKVSEAHTLIPEMITQRPENGNRSFSHTAYLEQFPDKRNQEQEGFVDFISYEFQNLAENLPLYSLSHYYHLMPSAMDLKDIIDAFNAVEVDKDVDNAIWQSDDVLGWLYESYNNYKKIAHKDSKAKTEYDKVSIQSQVYTPKWVVKFLVDNSLGKQYLEMYPYSDIKNKYAIANAPTERVREPKPLTEIKLIDPAMGSGNFLLYAFDVFYDLYQDQIDNFGADYDERDIPKLILEHNLYGVDLDNRAAQIAQLGLYIKARRKKRNIKIEHFNLVSSDFILPPYEQVKHIFFPSEEKKTTAEQVVERVVISLWDDLMQAHKFGALIRIEEIVEQHLSAFEKSEVTLFTSAENETYLSFRKSFINDLYQAVSKYASTGVQNFMQVQAANAVTYLDVLTNKYDVAVANPPYTDSADFGPELKTFVEKHYKKQYKFHTNLYATFIKRCCELTNEEGKVAMIHPHTFMFIKSFEDVRKYMIDKTQIDLLVDYGLDRVNLFGPGILLDATWYVLSKKKQDNHTGIYFNITANQQEKTKKESFEKALRDIKDNTANDRVYFLDQEKLKIIDSWPFIYWISDEFREKFDNESINDVLNPRQGIATGSNEKFVRFWWEVDSLAISKNMSDNLRWKNYAKGGPYQKWFGNNWAIIDWKNDGKEIKNFKGSDGKLKSRVQAKDFYYQVACTYSASGSKGVSFRLMEENSLFDVGGSCIFMGKYSNPYYTLALLNSHLTFYIVKCFNPTVNTQVGDIKRLPFVKPDKNLESSIESLVKSNIEKIKELNEYSIIEQNFIQSILKANNNSIKTQLFNSIEKLILYDAFILFNEYIINELIFEEYGLNFSDRQDVENSFGKLLGGLPITNSAKNEFVSTFKLNELQINYLDKIVVDDSILMDNEGFESLYNSNNNLEEFSKRKEVNPINVWYWFKEAHILPMGKAKEIALEFVTDHIRTLLAQDDDGIIPLYAQALESRLIDRLVNHLHEQGFSAAQIAELDQFLGKPLEKYIEENFFEDLANHLNLFMYLPKTPFIWHLSSGKYKAFEVYTSIYQWNRDSIFKLKAVYVAKRREQLQLRLSDIREAESAAAQAEKELIAKQFIELDAFEAKLDELIAENYNPILDSGVAKNIAPLQKKGMIKADILKAPQLTKYLNADW